jgi:hypothetical protein
MGVYQPLRHNIEYPCPRTNRPLEIKMKTDADGLATVWTKTIRVRCHHCGTDHDVSLREAYLDHVLLTAGMRPGGK